MSEILSRSFLDIDMDNLKKNTKFVEEFNTASFPSKKYYNLAKWYLKEKNMQIHH